jgi:hypothetical protein
VKRSHLPILTYTFNIISGAAAAAASTHPRIISSPTHDDDGPSFQYAPSSHSHPLDILRGLSGMRIWLFRTATPLSRSDFAHQLDDGSSSGVGGGDDAQRRRRV